MSIDFDTPVETDEAADTHVETNEAEGAGAPEQAQAQPEPLDIPGRWTDEEKALIAKLDPQARSVIFGRYKETLADQTRRAQEAAELRKRYTPIEEILAPRRQQFAMNGLDEARAIQQLFALSDYAANDPAGFMRMFAQQRGLNPAEIFQIQQAAEQANMGGYVDPQLQAVQQELAALKQAQAQQQQFWTQAAKREETARYSGAMNEVERFKSAKTQDGKPAHPHYEAVSGAMAVMLQADPNVTLEEAYARACWAEPSIREAMLAEKQRADALAAKEKAQRAKLAGSSLSNAASGEPARAKTGMSVRETILSAMAHQNARA